MPSAVNAAGVVRVCSAPVPTSADTKVPLPRSTDSWAPASAVNWMLGEATLERPSPLRPLSLASVSENGVSEGAAVSMAMVLPPETSVRLPAASVAAMAMVSPPWPMAVMSARVMA